MHKIYTVKAHFLFLSCKDAKFRAYPRVEWSIILTFLDPPGTASRNQCAAQIEWSLRGSGRVPSTQRIPVSHVLYLLALGRTHAQKWFWHNWLFCTHPLCPPRVSNIWYAVQQALITLGQRDSRRWNVNPVVI